jgi:hypothetical protein
MDSESIRSLLIPLHAFFGMVGLTFGLIALVQPKRAGRHTLFGAAFFWLLLLAIAISVPVILLSKNIFLGGLGSVALYLTIMGYRIGRIRPPNACPTTADRACVWLGIVTFSVFVLLGLWVLKTGQMLGLVMVFLGGLGASSALKHRRFFADPQGDPENWMQHHGSTLGGAVIASATAFTAAALTNWLPTFPEWVLWTAPPLLLSPILKKQLRRGTAD